MLYHIASNDPGWLGVAIFLFILLCIVIYMWQVALYKRNSYNKNNRYDKLIFLIEFPLIFLIPLGLALICKLLCIIMNLF